MIPEKSFFTRIAEAAGLFCVAAWLIRTGICLLQSVQGWLIGLVVLGVVITVIIRIRKHYKDTHF